MLGALATARLLIDKRLPASFAYLAAGILGFSAMRSIFWLKFVMIKTAEYPLCPLKIVWNFFICQGAILIVVFNLITSSSRRSVTVTPRPKLDEQKLNNGRGKSHLNECQNDSYQNQNAQNQLSAQMHEFR